MTKIQINNIKNTINILQNILQADFLTKINIQIGDEVYYKNPCNNENLIYKGTIDFDLYKNLILKNVRIHISKNINCKSILDLLRSGFDFSTCIFKNYKPDSVIKKSSDLLELKNKNEPLDLSLCIPEYYYETKYFLKIN